MNGERVSLKIHFNRGGLLTEFKNLFEDLENAYNHLYALELLVADAKRIKEYQYSKDFIFYRFRIPELYYGHRLLDVKNIVTPEDKIILNKIVIESPGWAEVVGSLNPLETIRKYLNDRHERRKDKEWREDAEKRKMELDNKIKEAKYIQEASKALKEAGFTEIEIRQILSEHYHDPLEKLSQYQDSDLIEGSED